MDTLQRIAAIGDIHAEDQTLERVLDHLAGFALDRILAVGDIVDGPGDSARCCRLLAAAGVDVVRGNHDRWATTLAARSGAPDKLLSRSRAEVSKNVSAESAETRRRRGGTLGG